MRNFLLAALAAVALCGAGLGGALGQNNRWVEVTNDSDFVAVNIYIVPSNVPSKLRDCCWSRDLLETEVIWRKDRRETDPLNFLKINFDDGSGECVFDIRVTTPFPGWEWLFTDVNVCRILKIRLEGKYARSNDKRHRRVTIKNESRLAALGVYAIPAKWAGPKDETCCWSYNLLQIPNPLRPPEIPKQDEYTVDFDDGMKTCEFHIRITSEKKGTDWYLKDVNVCSVQSITLKTKSQPRKIKIENKSSVKAVGAFIIPKGEDCCPSNNLLPPGRGGIGKDESAEVVVDDESGRCEYEYRITRKDKSTPWQGIVDICKPPAGKPLPEITLNEVQR